MDIEMTDNTLGQILAHIADLLDSVGESRIAQSFAGMAQQAWQANNGQELQKVAREVLKLNGGMGSFNDLVLQDAQGVRPEQARLEGLRTRLFEVAGSLLR